VSDSAKELEESAIMIVQIMHQFVGITRTPRERAITYNRIAIAAVTQNGSSDKTQYGRCFCQSGEPPGNIKTKVIIN